MIASSIARVARKRMARAMTFNDDATVLPAGGDDGVSRLLYLHVPFCESLCPYCSFNRVLFDEQRCRSYFEALRKELDLYRERGYDFSALYVGGGTPTIMLDELATTLARVRALFSVGDISLETNPNHLTDEAIDVLKGSGVNRLSVGVQSFDDDVLITMGRFGTFGSGAAIADRLRDIQGRFDTLNVDMIFNVPGQSEASLGRDLDVLMELKPDQVTWYPLMVSDTTRQAVSKTMGTVDARRERRFYELIARRLLEEYRYASSWCFSREQSMIDEYIVDYTEYAGLGSGSIGYLGGRCYANTFSIDDYIASLGEERLPLMASRGFESRELVHYEFLMRLFGNGLPLSDILERYRWPGLVRLASVLVPFVLVGAVTYRDGRFVATRRGRYYWVVLMREFFIAVNNFRDYCRERREEDAIHEHGSARTFEDIAQG